MLKHKLLYVSAGLLLGFAAGFFFANGVNRKGHESLRAELARVRAGAEKSRADGQPQKLSEEELRQAVARGDASPGDVQLQRQLGRGLYLYAVNFDQPSVIPDAVRMLKRAHDADPRDRQTTVMLGNALLDAARLEGNSARFAEARAYFIKALEADPEDADARAALGMTYYFDRPPDAERAAREYRQALTSNPRHEGALEGLAASLTLKGELSEAERRVKELEGLNPSNPALPSLRAQLAQKANAAGDIEKGATQERR